MPNFTLIVTELRNSKYDDSKTKLGPNSRTEMVKKLSKKVEIVKKKKKLKTQFLTKLK